MTNSCDLHTLPALHKTKKQKKKAPAAWRVRAKKKYRGNLSVVYTDYTILSISAIRSQSHERTGVKEGIVHRGQPPGRG